MSTLPDLFRRVVKTLTALKKVAESYRHVAIYQTRIKIIMSYHKSIDDSFILVCLTEIFCVFCDSNFRKL